MKKLKSKFSILLYSLSGLGVNMLNLIMTSYLLDAVMTEGFHENIENWTFFNKTIVVAGVWSISILIAKILDGVIDVPFSSWCENIRSKWGKRRPAILIGLVLTILSFVGFINPITYYLGLGNLSTTIYLAVMLCAFYAFYTLTMLTFYATFSEVVDNDKDRMFLSNCKSVFDVVYFIFGYALIPALIGSQNIRIIAYIFLPLSLTMLIPLFMLKEDSTAKKDTEDFKYQKPLSIIESIKYSIKNKDFMKWMLTYCFLQFGIQMFLTGQNVYCSGVAQFSGGTLAILNAFSFAPVPLTLILYNKIIKKKGFKCGFIYALSMFVIGMALFALCNPNIFPNETTRIIIGIFAALFCSLGIGSFFSVEYVIPSSLAAKEREEKGRTNPGMYFAVQGLVGGVISGISTGLVWVKLLKDNNLTNLLVVIVAISCIFTIISIFFLPKEIDKIGKDETNEKVNRKKEKAIKIEEKEEKEEKIVNKKKTKNYIVTAKVTVTFDDNK